MEAQVPQTATRTDEVATPTPAARPSTVPSPTQAERRRFRRHAARERRGWIGWWINHEFHAEAVLLTDIGLGGVAVAMLSDGPREGDDVLLRLDQIKRADQCARARVVGRSVDESGRYLLRLRFITECPAELYFATVHGLSDHDGLN